MKVFIRPQQRMNGLVVEVPEVLEIPDGLTPDEQNEAVQTAATNAMVLAFMDLLSRSANPPHPHDVGTAEAPCPCWTAGRAGESRPSKVLHPDEWRSGAENQEAEIQATKKEG